MKQSFRRKEFGLCYYSCQGPGILTFWAVTCFYPSPQCAQFVSNIAKSRKKKGE